MATYYYLSEQERVDIIVSHIRSNEYNLYNVEIGKLEELASPTPDQSKLDSYDLQILEYQSKISALVAEKDSLTGTV